MNNYPTDDDDDAGAIANAIPSKQERLLIKRPRGRTRARVCVWLCASEKCRLVEFLIWPIRHKSPVVRWYYECA